MRDIFNGYAPGETKIGKFRPKKADKDHTVVEYRSQRLGHSWTIRYTLVCQCGKQFSSKTSAARAGYAHDAHVRKEA